MPQGEGRYLKEQMNTSKADECLRAGECLKEGVTWWEAHTGAGSWQDP